MQSIREHIAIAAMLASIVSLLPNISIPDAVRLSAGPKVPKLRLNPDEVQTKIRQIARWIPGATCIPQAIVARTWLLMAGHPSEVVIGFRKGKDWEGHAWLELTDGKCLFVESNASYTEVWRP